MSYSETRSIRYLFPKQYADVVQRLRVPCGFVLLAAFALLSHPSIRSMLIGLPISIAGLALRAWASGHLAKNQRLASSGPYAYVRNPLYLGTLLAAFGIVLASESAGLAAIFTSAFVFVYLPAIELEEQHLRQIFPEYTEYAARVNRLLPTHRWPGTPRPFSWALYRKNEEYKALLGFAVAVGWLAWRCWLVAAVT